MLGCSAAPSGEGSTLRVGSPGSPEGPALSRSQEAPAGHPHLSAGVFQSNNVSSLREEPSCDEQTTCPVLSTLAWPEQRHREMQLTCRPPEAVTEASPPQTPPRAGVPPPHGYAQASGWDRAAASVFTQACESTVLFCVIYPYKHIHTYTYVYMCVCIQYVYACVCIYIWGGDYLRPQASSLIATIPDDNCNTTRFSSRNENYVFLLIYILYTYTLYFTSVNKNIETIFSGSL